MESPDGLASFPYKHDPPIPPYQLQHLQENLFVYDVRYCLKKKPLVSIIIPTKDHVDDLRAAIDSIFSKTVYDEYEIIILDNNSEKKEGNI